MSKIKTLLFISILFNCIVATGANDAKGTFAVSAQQLLQNANSVATEKAAEVATILVERDFEIDANSRVTMRVHRIYRVETQEAVDDWSYTSVSYSPWHQDKPEIHARVITPDGVEHVLDQKVLTDAPSKDNQQEAIYDDNRVLQAPLPSVSKGSVVETEIVLRDREPLFSAGAYRASDFGSQWGPWERSVVTVKAPKSLPVQYVSRLLPNLSIQKKEEGDFIVYQFEQGRMEMLDKPEKNLPSDVPESPYLAFSTGKSWAAVASAYQASVEAKARVSDVQELVNKEIKPGTSRDEIIRKLVALLHRRVRYTGVEFGEAALIPAFPAETLKRGYGDCKDKSTLLVSMLRAAGIPAHLALLETGPGEDLEIELPAMAFDHAIVFVPGPPELWIDATASEHQVGPMPEGDAGRLALIVRDGTDKLVRIPETTPEDNVLMERREFFLAEYGPARIVETWHPQGIAEAYFRGSYANVEGKETRDSFNDYVKSAYLSEKMGKIEHSDASDLTVPFWLSIEVEKGRRGFTDLNDAVGVIDHTAILDRLPDFLKANDDELTDKEKAEKEKKPRTADFVFTPFVTEWQYRFVLPIGFQTRAVPEDKTEQLGPAKFTTTYAKDKSGALLVTLRIDSVKGRYTMPEAEAMRSAVRQFRKRDYVVIGFDNTGHALLVQGKVAQGLKEYEAVAAQHPKEALHRTQYASAMFDVGLCEAARTEARKATQLDPKSSRAQKELAWILQHDLVCRRLKKGFDYSGAVIAYRKTLELDPDDVYGRADLAILLEHGKDGFQYSPSSQLDDAIAEWKAIRKQKPETAKKYTDNLLFDLMYAKHWKELQEELTRVSMDATHRGMALAAVVVTDGTAAAIEQSQRITSDEASRSGALVTAGNYLIRLRQYSDAAEMLSAGAKGQSDPAAALQRAEVFRHTKRYEEILLPDTDPRSVVQKMMVISFKNGEDTALCALSAKRSMQGMTCEEIMNRSRTKLEMGKARAQITRSGLPADVLSDVVLSSLQMTAESDDKSGYRVMLQPLGAKSSAIYVVKEDGKYVVLGEQSDADDVCAEVLARLDANDLPGARKLLDWLRSDMQISGGDDPLAGKLFPRMWTRGQEGDADAMRAAALSMVDTRHDAARWIPDLIAARDKAKSETTKGYLEAALASTYSTANNWKELRDSALRLLAIFPTSDVARNLLLAGCAQLKDWEPIKKAIDARLAVVADDPQAQRQLASLYGAQGKFEESNAVLKKLIDAGRADASEMNSYAWNQLVMGRVSDDGIEQARRGMSLQKSYAVVHTLAAIYAEHGNPQEARQLLMNIMDDYGMDEPDGSLWYVFGRVAEVYEQPQAARACYKRVDWKEKFEPDPRTTYAMAQKRLTGLTAETAVGAK